MEKVVRKYKIGEEPDIIDDYFLLTYSQRLSVLKSIRTRFQYFNKKDHGTGFQRVYRIIAKARG